MRISKGLLGLIICLLSFQAFAGKSTDPFFDSMHRREKNWWWGVNTYYLSLDPSGEFEHIIHDSHAGFDIDLGHRVNDNFGFDMGYSWTVRNAKPRTVEVGEVFMGTVATATSTHSGNVRFKAWYFDLIGFYPFKKRIFGKNFELRYSLGLEFNRQKFSFTHIPTDNAVQGVLDTIQGKTRPLVRAGFGFNFMLTETTGLQLATMVKSYSKVHVRGAPEGIDARVFKSGFLYIAGLFWRI